MTKDIYFFSGDTPQNPLLPNPQSLHLWVYNLETLVTSPPSADFLSEEEKRHLEAFSIPEEGKKFMLRRYILRTLLSQYLQKPRHEIEIRRKPNEKPFIPDCPLQFSLSHAENWLAIAFSLQDTVGVDIAIMHSLKEEDQNILNRFSPEEQLYIEKGSIEEKAARFWEIWTRKEACLKVLGLSIDEGLFHLDCLGAQSEKKWSYLEDRRVWVYSQVHRPYYALAVAYAK